MTDMINEKIKHMVFIDDDAVNNFLMQTRLETYGYKGDAIFFDAANEALQYLSKLEGIHDTRPDIIFLDIKMPKMDGFEFLEAFKEQKLNIKLPTKIFMVSSSTNQTDRRRSVESGLVHDFIEKPLSIEHIDRIADCYFS